MDRLSNLIKCVNCRNILDSPVLLPCGDSICKKHTQNIQGPILCHTCEIEHEIPAKGFPLNKALAEMVKTEIINLDFGNVHKEAKQSCQKFDELLAKIEQLLNDPFNFIHEPIDYLINVVQLKGEQMIMEINTNMNQMIKEINDKKDRIISKLDEYKNECKKGLGEKEYLVKSENLSKENEIGRKRLEKWLATLNEIKVNEQEWKRIKSDSEKAIKIHEKKLVKFKMDLFPSRLEQFQTEIEKDFGKFEVDSSFNLWRSRIKFELESAIVIDSSLREKLFLLCGFETIQKFRLLYRGSLNGFRASNFHEKCDNISKTLTIIKAAESGNIFGGYTEATWNDNSIPKIDNKAFIFSLVNKENKPLKVNVSSECGIAIEGDINYGPVFGSNFISRGNLDIKIVDNSNSSDKNCSKLGTCYIHPDYPPGSASAYKFLAGSYQFRVEEIEVFQRL